MTKSRIRMDEQTSEAVNTDGWQNVLLNLGNRGDATARSKFARMLRLDKQTLSDLFAGDGLGKRVVTLPVDDAIREWIEGDDNLKLELSRIGAKKEIKEAAYWSRLFGGSLVVALLDDGMDFDQPVNPEQIRRVMELRTYDRHRVTWTTADVQSDPASPNFGRVEVYTVQPITGGTYRVHASRCWRFDGLALPEEDRQRNQGWGDSALQAVYNALMNYGNTMLASANIIRDFVQAVLGVKGLAEMIRAGEEKNVANRANIIDLTRSVANLVMIDADGETYDKKASSVAGLADLWDRFALHVCATTGIPATKLIGRSPSGLNATGEGDQSNWYDVVREYQTDEIQPAIQWLVDLLEAQRDWRDTDRPETMDWNWPALDQPTEAEWAQVKKTNAEVDQVYMQANAGIDPEYLYYLRFGQGEYRAEINYDQAAYLEWLADREALTGGDTQTDT